MNVIREIERINERELQLGIDGEGSWHAKYKKSAYVYVGGIGGLGLTEGDIITVFSQFGEVVDCNMVRDKRTGESKGFCFVAFENQKSTILAVDNMNGYKLLGKTLRVDHVLNYRRPKGEKRKEDAKKEEDKTRDELGNLTDEEYDERRKKIWDYELYEGYGSTARQSEDDAQESDVEMGEEQSGQPPSAQSQHQDRVMKLLEERKREREIRRKAEELGIPAEKLLAQEAEKARREKDKGEEKSKKKKSKDKKHHKHKHDRRSRSRSRSKSRSRSQDKKRKHRRDSSRERSRERARDRSRDRRRDD